MHILIIGKYPPIEGGVSSRTYWLARGLGERGHKVSVVTNALRVEEEYQEKIDLKDSVAHAEYHGKNVFIYSLSKPAPGHIPYSEGFVSRLTNKGLHIIGSEKVDVVYAHYLEPYGVAGLLLKKLTDTPLVVQHAGSDIYRLLRNDDYSYILARVFMNADKAILSRSLSLMAQKLKVPYQPIPPAGMNTKYFSPEGEPFDFESYGFKEPDSKIPIITYIGKLGTHKGFFELLEALTHIQEDFRLLLVSQGAEQEKLNSFLKEHPTLKAKVMLLGFVAPWEIPKILRSTSLLVHLEYNFPIPIHSPIQPFEAVACGTTMLLSKEMFDKIALFFPRSKKYFNVVDDPSDISALTQKIQYILDNKEEQTTHAKKITSEFLTKNDWETYLDTYITTFKKVSSPNIFKMVLRFFKNLLSFS